MHSLAWANASPAMDLYADPLEQEAVVLNTTCKREGCGEQRSKHGYCDTHARAFTRYGHPDGKIAKAREDLFAAAHAYGDDITVLPWTKLAEAAVDYAVATGDGKWVKLQAGVRARVLEGRVSVEGWYLGKSALAYTDHDSTLPLASFEAVQERLEIAAKKFFRSLMP